MTVGLSTMRRMNGFVRVCLTDVDRVIGSIGSGDEELLERIIGRHKDDFVADAAERAAGEVGEFDAVRMLILEDPGSYPWADAHNSAFETIMGMFDGRWLADVEHARLERIGEGLAGLGVDAIYANDLTCGTPWANEDCRQAWWQWRAATAEQRAEVEPEVLTAIDEWMQWLHEAASTSHLGVLGALSWG